MAGSIVEKYPGEVPPQVKTEAEKYPGEAPPYPVGFKPPEGSKAVDFDARGRPTAFEKAGVKYYTPNSPMWNLGYRTSEEYQKSGETYPSRQESPKEAAPFVAVKTEKGEPAHVAKEEIAKVAEKEPIEQFKALQKMGIIEKGSEFVPGKGTQWSYIPTIQKQKQERFAKETGKLEKLIEAFPITKEFKKTHIKLKDGQWVSKKDWNALPEKYQTVGLRQGFDDMFEAIEADAKDFRDIYEELPDGQWMAKADLMQIKAQSPALYDKLTNQGFDAYEAGISKAKTLLSGYKTEGDKYNVLEAMLDASKRKDKKLEDAIDILFDKQTLAEIRYKNLPRLTMGKGQPEAALKKAIPYLATAGVITTATPIPFDDILFWAAVGGLAAFGGLKINQVIREYKNKTGTSPSLADIVVINKEGQAFTALEMLPELRRTPGLVPPSIAIKPESVTPPEVRARLEGIKGIELPRYGEGVKGMEPVAVYLPTPATTREQITKQKAGLMLADAMAEVAERKLKGVPGTKTLDIDWNKLLKDAQDKEKREQIRQTFAQIEKAFDNEDHRRRFHNAYQDYLRRLSLLQAAWSQYIRTLNPQPIKGPDNPKYAMAYQKWVVGKISEDADARDLIAEAVKVYNKAIEQGKTETQAQMAVQTTLQTRLAQKLGINTRTLAKIAAQVAAKVAVKTAVKTAVATKARTAARAAEAARTAEATTTMKPIKPFKLPRLGGPAKEEPWTPEEVESALAWKEGFVVHAIKAPYRRGIDETTFHIKNLPEGLEVMPSFKGPGSAQASVRSKGQIPKRTTVDVGFEDVIITRGRNKRPRLQHLRDTRGTVSNLTVRRHKGRNISKKRQRVYHTRAGGGTILSHEPLMGY